MLSTEHNITVGQEIVTRLLTGLIVTITKVYFHLHIMDEDMGEIAS